MKKTINLTIWNEFRHEKTEEVCKKLYPEGIHGCIKNFLSDCDDLNIRLASLDEPCAGLPDSVLDTTDVLIWWGHKAHNEVPDELVEKINTRINKGLMGLLVLHSGHESKVFKRVIGSNGQLSWGRDQKAVVWTLMPQHPVAKGLPDHFVLDCEELYSEPFLVPQPDALVFGSWYEDGFIFRSGLAYVRGAGRVFYFQPGHEYCASLYNENVQKVIKNAVYWVAPSDLEYTIQDGCKHVEFKPCEESAK